MVELTAELTPCVEKAEMQHPEAGECEEAADDGACDRAAAFIRGALLLQERWVLMIVHSLLAGPTGFSVLMRRGNINTTTLTQRLNLLEQEGLLVKTIHSTMPPRTSYELTEAGRALKPILDAIGQWSGTYLMPPAMAEGCPKEEASEASQETGGARKC